MRIKAGKKYDLVVGRRETGPHNVSKTLFQPPCFALAHAGIQRRSVQTKARDKDDLVVGRGVVCGVWGVGGGVWSGVWGVGCGVWGVGWGGGGAGVALENTLGREHNRERQRLSPHQVLPRGSNRLF